MKLVENESPNQHPPQTTMNPLTKIAKNAGKILLVAFLAAILISIVTCGRKDSAATTPPANVPQLEINELQNKKNHGIAKAGLADLSARPATVTPASSPNPGILQINRINPPVKNDSPQAASLRAHIRALEYQKNLLIEEGARNVCGDARMHLWRTAQIREFTCTIADMKSALTQMQGTF